MPVHRRAQVLLRHGRSEWNDRNLFTGWVDSDLSERGLAEARRAGELMEGAANAVLAAIRKHNAKYPRQDRPEPQPAS